MLSSNADTLKKDDSYINNEINIAEILNDACVNTLGKTTQRVLNQQSSDSFFFFFFFFFHVRFSLFKWGTLKLSKPLPFNSVFWNFSELIKEIKLNPWSKLP